MQRHKQAAIVHDFGESILTVEPGANVIVAGDLNDFQFSETVGILKQGVLEDLVDTLPENERYSYVFEGNSQTLDHILLSAALFGEPFDYDIVHVNAEFADQASDPEPSVVRIGLDEARASPWAARMRSTRADLSSSPRAGTIPRAARSRMPGISTTTAPSRPPGQSATFSAAGLDGPSARTVAVQFADEGGLTVVSEATVNVANVAPGISASFDDASVGCGANNATLDVTFSDPGPDTFTASVDWGDGSAAEPLGSAASPFSAGRTYPAADSYRATVTVTDDDGDSGFSGASVRVDYDVKVLPPLGDPATDVFKSNSTIPAKITVADCDGSHPSDLAPRINVVKNQARLRTRRSTSPSRRRAGTSPESCASRTASTSTTSRGGRCPTRARPIASGSRCRTVRS